MADRKVLNRYIPPDFDPAKVPKGHRKDKNACEVTMMLPFSIQCKTCSEFMYKGKKVNSKKEDVMGRTYLGIQIYRFTMKCSQCNANYSIVTDPEHLDYAVELGVTRNFEPWREAERAEAEAVAARAESEKSDAMRALENRTLDSKRQMDIIDALEEIRALRGRQAGMTTDDVLAALAAAKGQDARGAALAALEAEREDAEAAAAAFAKGSGRGGGGGVGAGQLLHRLPGAQGGNSDGVVIAAVAAPAAAGVTNGEGGPSSASSHGFSGGAGSTFGSGNGSGSFGVGYSSGPVKRLRDYEEELDAACDAATPSAAGGASSGRAAAAAASVAAGRAPGNGAVAGFGNGGGGGSAQVAPAAPCPPSASSVGAVGEAPLRDGSAPPSLASLHDGAAQGGRAHSYQQQQGMAEREVDPVAEAALAFADVEGRGGGPAPGAGVVAVQTGMTAGSIAGPAPEAAVPARPVPRQQQRAAPRFIIREKAALATATGPPLAAAAGSAVAGPLAAAAGSAVAVAVASGGSGGAPAPPTAAAVPAPAVLLVGYGDSGSESEGEA